jgi:hypothetical protein
MDFCSQKGYLVLYDDDESHWEPAHTVTAGERELDGTPIIPALKRDRRLIPVSSESKAESEETHSCVATLASALERRRGDGRHKLSEQDQQKEKEGQTQMMNLSRDLYQQALQERQRREAAAAHAPNKLRPYCPQNPYWQAALGTQSHAGGGVAAQKTRRDKVSERHALKMALQPVSLPPLPSVTKRRKSDPKRTLNTIFEGAVQAMWDENRSFPFRSAVNCPQYRALIANPMDLKVMKSRCYGLGRFESAGLCRSEALYDSKEEFVADVAKMVSNCRTYNEFRNPQLVSDVLELEQICHAKLEESKSAIVEAEAMIGLGRKLAAWTQELMTAEVEQPQTPTPTKVLKFEAFVAPVTTKEYSTVIKQPMDLKRMMSKAQSYSYCSHRGWLEDLRLVRDNCHLFCATRHPDLPPIADQLLARGEALAGEDSGTLQTLEGQVAQRERERARVRESKKERDRKRERELEQRQKEAKRVRESKMQIDLDRICGLTLETGHRCMRTIDCQTHTQLAKQGVLGRSRPYDELFWVRRALKASQQQANECEGQAHDGDGGGDCGFFPRHTAAAHTAAAQSAAAHSAAADSAAAHSAVALEDEDDEDDEDHDSISSVGSSSGPSLSTFFAEAAPGSPADFTPSICPFAALSHLSLPSAPSTLANCVRGKSGIDCQRGSRLSKGWTAKAHAARLRRAIAVPTEAPEAAEQSEASSGQDSSSVIVPQRKQGPHKKHGRKEGVVVTMEILESVFHKPLHEACNSLGVCATALKGACRKLGVQKLPYRWEGPGVSRLDAVVRVLKATGKALHYDVITRQALQQGIIRFTGSQGTAGESMKVSTQPVLILIIFLSSFPPSTARSAPMLQFFV